MEPWTKERRSQVKRKIDREATRTAARLKAKGCVVIAFFDAGGGYFHIQDGGITPMNMKELYRNMLATVEKLELSGGEDVAVQ